jgi:pyruvate dehydrogenase E2 component (dihydrolipoamide acetyltransferase)
MTRTWSPLVRRLAERAQLDLATVTGTGPGGSVRRCDVEAALVSPARAAQGARTLRASPRARRYAADQGIALDSVAASGGSGPGGALTGDDVLRYAAAGHPPSPTTISPAVTSPAAPARATARASPDRASAQRRAIGALMARSKHEIPHYYLSTDVDLTPALDHLAHLNADRPPAHRVLPAALLLQAIAQAAVQVPGFNGRYVDGEGFVAAETVDLGVALALRQGGLVAPTLPAADALGLDELMAALRDLVARARSGRLRASDTRAATLTVTNLGDRGARSVHGVIVPPQVALVGIGRVEPRPWVVGDAVVPRQVVTLTLSADHRVTSGHEGSRFLDAIAVASSAPEGP